MFWTLCSRPARSAEPRPGRLSFHEFVERGLRVFGGLVLLAALRHQRWPFGHEVGERVVQIVVIELARLGAVRGGPVELVRIGFGLVQLLQLGGFGALVAFGNLLQLIGQRADFAARVLEIGSHGGALAIEQIDLFGDLAVGGKRSAAGAIHGGLQLLVVGRGVKGLFVGAALGDLLLEIGGV